MWNRKVFIRIIEVVLCIACVVALRVTNDESRRVFHYLRSRSREWSLLNNVTWGAIGAALATATCGGYIIITTGLLIAAATGELSGRKTEVFFLGLGVILFGIVGALSMASIENVPEDLIDNAAVFGALCLLTALVFIADLLMSTPKKKIEQAIAKHLTNKKGKSQAATSVMTEKESKFSETSSPKVSKKNEDGTVNDGFEKVEERHQKSSSQELSEDPRKWDQDRSSNQLFKGLRRDEDGERYIREESVTKEYAQNFENGRALRNSQIFRSSEAQINGRKDSYKMDHRMEMPTVVYKAQDIYQRPVDEVDTPRFPTEMNGRSETTFAKMVNPGVKIMKVEHDVDEAFDVYRYKRCSALVSEAFTIIICYYYIRSCRLPTVYMTHSSDQSPIYSDTSQYDNVPIRMRGTSPSQKKNRDVSFNIPPPPKGYGKAYDKTKDEIEMLEDCFGALRTTSTGTQTPGTRTPSSPTDPGYVRHTASNWPQETKTKTPGSSPNHTRN